MRARDQLGELSVAPAGIESDGECAQIVMEPVAPQRASTGSLSGLGQIPRPRAPVIEEELEPASICPLGAQAVNRRFPDAVLRRETVVTRLEMTVRGAQSGVGVPGELTQVVEVANGRIQSARFIRTWEAALEAAGLEE